MGAWLSSIADDRLVEPTPLSDLRLQPAGTIDHPGQFARHLSPLRYPGAKSRMVKDIAAVIEAARRLRSVPSIELFVEPFAGGASTSLRLVSLGLVERVLLADADPLVASFWMVAAARPEELIDRMNEEHAGWVKPGGRRALERWDYWRTWEPDPADNDDHRRLETAVRCLFLNRTTFSGILHGGAGPIGGRKQQSVNDIGCRYMPGPLAERIRYIGHLYARGRIVDVLEADWQTTMESALDVVPNLSPDNVLCYLDPPYVDKASELYNKAFGPRPIDDGPVWQGEAMDHLRLAGYLRTATPFRWLLSYDKHPALLTHPLLYASGRVSPRHDLTHIPKRNITKRVVPMTYTASAGRGRSPSEELLITTLPASALPLSDRMKLPSG